MNYTSPSRIVVIGTSGSGKTTFAGRIARLLGIPHVELDALHWEPNWTEAPDHTFRERVAAAIAGDCWVVDGNYSKIRDLVWPRAELVVWLDFPLPVMLWRVVSRTLRRAITREELWSGNRERLRESLLSRDSIILWTLTTYRRHRRNYPDLVRRPEHAHLQLVRLRSPREARRWLATFPSVKDQEAEGRRALRQW